MNFFLFILVTATLFVRPGEIIPMLRGWEFFFYLIVPCLVLSIPSVLGQLSKRSLQSQPITVCVLGLMIAVVLSNALHLDIDTVAIHNWSLFLKNLIYYILFISLISTSIRLRKFLFWLWFFSLLFIVLTLLKHLGLIELSMEETLNDNYGTLDGEQVVLERMTGSGIFGDPNDMCVVIVIGFILSLYWMEDRLFPVPWLLCAASSLTFGYALLKTQSRGGFIALVAACGVLLLTRYGWKKAAMLGGAGLPLLLLAFKGRITNISTQEATGHSRIQLWSDSFDLFRSSPLFGIGIQKIREYIGYVAHNSYMQAYAELGLFGGTLFTGAVFLALWAFYRLGAARGEIADPSLRRAQPFMMAITAGFATLLMTITQTYYMSTYMLLGLATAYLHTTNATNILPGFRVGFPLVKRLALFSMSFLVVFYIFVRLFK